MTNTTETNTPVAPVAPVAPAPAPAPAATLQAELHNAMKVALADKKEQVASAYKALYIAGGLATFPATIKELDALCTGKVAKGTYRKWYALAQLNAGQRATLTRSIEVKLGDSDWGADEWGKVLDKHLSALAYLGDLVKLEG